MNLFDSIGLKSDPFSTSPNVELFYPAAHHRQCLEGLELAIRMRRGLSVVRGGIGVGKTTVSRKLIQNFKKESDDFDFYLILDPKFESEIILLQHIIELFGVDEKGDSVQACRNIIENYLLKVGVEQGKVLVLIIDEGQNLPGEMLDVFRTLLNFETDDFKLLQLIIFGQPEMGNMIHKYPNFEDRISFDFEIGPTSIDDMRGMIDHRIVVCGGNEGDWFTDAALKKIHKNTQGYPRKVTQLCHQALLTMMSEGKKEITESIVQKVISGTSNSTGLLKQKKKNYNEIAVNKLLDVLKKDKPKSDSTLIENEENFDDDWIGGSVENVINGPNEQLNVKNEEVEQKSSEKEIVQEEGIVDSKNQRNINRDKSSKQTFIQELIPKKNTSKPISDLIIEEKPISSPIKKIKMQTDSSIKSDKIDDKQQNKLRNELKKKKPLPNPGIYPPYHPAYNKITIDNISIGIGIDSGIFTAILTEDKKGIKTLLAHHIQFSKLRNLNSEKDSQDFIDECNNLLKGLTDNFSERANLYKSAFKLLQNCRSIHVNINDESMLMTFIEIIKENRKDKDQIIKWGMKKKFPQFGDDFIIDVAKGNGDRYNVGIGKKSHIESINNQFKTLSWEIRKWTPTAQSVFNSFYWNYPDYLNKTILLINIGERNSTISGLQNSSLQVTDELRIGIQDLNDALSDQGVSIEKWSDRGSFQVPRSFILAAGKKVDQGLYDNIFTPVFEIWQQDINRSINSLRKVISLNNDTQIFLSGSASEILYLDDFFEGFLNYKSTFLNPVRNLAFSPNYIDRDQFQFHPSLLTSAIGSTIKTPNSVSVMLPDLKLNEIFRWVNRLSSIAAIILFIFLATITAKTKIDKDAIESEILPIESENESLSLIKGEYDSLIFNTDNIRSQLKTLNYDTEYFNRILIISRFLSFNTPKEINFDEVNFTIGWDKKVRRKKGRTFKTIIKKTDENVRILRLAGYVKANPAILERHFENYVTSLENSGLFQLVEVMDEQTPSKDIERIEFVLKCVI